MPLDGPVFLMDKIQVNGDNADPIWAYAKKLFRGDISWNFAGIFLFDSSGACVGRFSSRELDSVGAAIDALM